MLGIPACCAVNGIVDMGKGLGETAHFSVVLPHCQPCLPHICPLDASCGRAAARNRQKYHRRREDPGARQFLGEVYPWFTHEFSIFFPFYGIITI